MYILFTRRIETFCSTEMPLVYGVLAHFELKIHKDLILYQVFMC